MEKTSLFCSDEEEKIMNGGAKREMKMLVPNKQGLLLQRCKDDNKKGAIFDEKAIQVNAASPSIYLDNS